MRVKRLLAAVIDFYIACIFSTLIIAVITLGKLNVTALTIGVYVGFFVLCMMAKDVLFKGASIGKRICKIKVVRADGKMLTVADAIKRTVPLLLPPIEVICLLTRDKRLGDLWADTAVVDRKTGDVSVS